MSRRGRNAQITSYKTNQMYLRQMLTLAKNVYIFKNLSKFIYMPYVNGVLLKNGSIAFFYDEVIEELVALPYTSIGSLDMYGRPIKIQVFGLNGYTRVLNEDEFVIMYDNNGQYPIYVDIVEYANRMSQAERIIDINIVQQKCPRIFKCKPEQLETLKQIINDIDGDVDAIATYEDISINDIQVVCEPSPYIVDKIQEQKDKYWNEFLRLIGISNLSMTKKERSIRDEIIAMQGGTIASRYSRFETRKSAVEEINKKFGQYLDKEIIVEYYDKIPTSTEDEEIETEEVEEVSENV